MAESELTSLEILERIFGKENVVASKVYNMDSYLVKVAGSNASNAEILNQVVEDVVALPNNSSKGDDYGVVIMGAKFDAIAKTVLEKAEEIRAELGIKDLALEALNALVRARIGIEGEWTFDAKENVYRMPFDYPPRDNVSEEYSTFINKIRDERVSDLIEDMEAGMNDAPAAGYLERTNAELIVKNPNPHSIREIIERAAKSTGTVQEQSNEEDMFLLMAQQLKFTGPKTGEKLPNYGEWEVSYNEDFMRDEVSILTMPQGLGRPGMEASQIAKDMNFTLGGEFNDVARFDTHRKGRELYLTLEDVQDPLRFDEHLEKLQETASAWAGIDEQHMLDARAMPEYIRPTIRVPVPEDVKILEKLELRELMPEGVIPPREDGMTFEYFEHDGDAKVLRVPIVAGERLTSIGAAKALSTSMATASEDQLETRIKAGEYQVVVDPHYLDNKSSDTADAMLAMRDGAPLSWVDKALGAQEPQYVPDLIRAAQFLEITGIGEDTTRLEATFDAITDSVLSVRERLEKMMARNDQNQRTV